MEDFEFYADNHGYKVVQITSDRNGYPRNLHYGAIGFDDINEAEQFAKKTGGYVVVFRRRDGHHFYTYEGFAYEPFNLISIFNNIARGIFTKDDLNTQYLKDYLEYMEDSEADKLLCTIRGLEPNQFVLLWDGGYYEVLPIETMSYSYDVYTYEIGVVQNLWDSL